MSNRQERRARRFPTGPDSGIEVRPTGQVRMTGAQVDRVTNPDRLTAPLGVHLWTTMVAFQVHQPARWASEEQHLDMENMLYVSPPGCFVCEQVWAPGLELTACPGDPGVG